MEKKAATPLKIGQEEVYRLFISHRIAEKKLELFINHIWFHVKILFTQYLPSIISCFILAISFLISLRISCFIASNSAFDAEFGAALFIAFSAMPFNLVTSISSALEPNRLLPGFGDSEPLEDFPVGDEPFSKFFRSPESSWNDKNSISMKKKKSVTTYSLKVWILTNQHYLVMCESKLCSTEFLSATFMLLFSKEKVVKDIFTTTIIFNNIIS